jgi:type I restriction enzyme S subunit
LPSLAEQFEIVTEVAETLSQIVAAETAIDRGLLRASRLRQSILKQAFEGKLVPQDPCDEPAKQMGKPAATNAGRFLNGRKKTALKSLRM